MRAIDPTCRVLRPLAEYSERLPSCRRGRRLNRATLWRWALKGARGRVLRTVTLGSGRMTCDAWVWEFVSQVGGAPARLGQAGVEAREDERTEDERGSSDTRCAS